VSFEPPDLTGAVLSQKYRLQKRIGYGGMGAVYVSQESSGELIAIKILNPDCLDNPEVVTRFLEEGKTCQKLIHPNIVRVSELAVAENGCPYLVMELLNGVPLSAYTANGGRVPLVQCITIVQGILQALMAAHTAGIVHRDLKPENVFLARDKAGSFTVKLLDFGIAKVMDVAGGMGKRTRTGVLLGTPSYMSPEQIKSTKDVDARSDLFSVGVLAYEMLTGRPAFPAPTEYAKLAAVLNSEPAPLESVDPGLARIAPLLERALQKDRDRRFQSAGEMAQALGALAATAAPSIDLVAARMSALPAVPSVYQPPISMTPGGSVAPSVAQMAAAAERQTPSALIRMPTGLEDSTTGPGGTLASRKSTASMAAVRPSGSFTPGITGHGGTLPSSDIPMLEPVASGAPRLSSPGESIGRESEGVRPVWVVFLCMITMLLGIGIGVMIGRM
jgi:serine/threonine-protein kinase